MHRKGEGALCGPSRIRIEPRKYTVYIADTENDRVILFDKEGEPLGALKEGKVIPETFRPVRGCFVRRGSAGGRHGEPTSFRHSGGQGDHAIPLQVEGAGSFWSSCRFWSRSGASAEEKQMTPLSGGVPMIEGMKMVEPGAIGSGFRDQGHRGEGFQLRRGEGKGARPPRLLVDLLRTVPGRDADHPEVVRKVQGRRALGPGDRARRRAAEEQHRRVRQAGRVHVPGPDRRTGREGDVQGGGSVRRRRNPDRLPRRPRGKGRPRRRSAGSRKRISRRPSSPS